MFSFFFGKSSNSSTIQEDFSLQDNRPNPTIPRESNPPPPLLQYRQPIQSAQREEQARQQKQHLTQNSRITDYHSTVSRENMENSISRASAAAATRSSAATATGAVSVTSATATTSAYSSSTIGGSTRTSRAAPVSSPAAVDLNHSITSPHAPIVSSFTPSAYSPPSATTDAPAVVIRGNRALTVDPYDVLAAALVPGALQSTYYTESTRHYVIGLFAYVNAMQQFVWCAFSTVPEYSNKFFHNDSSDPALLDLVLIWGPIFYLPVVFIASYLMTVKNGLRLCVQFACVFMCFGALVRMAPAFFSDEERGTYRTFLLFTLHLGSILNAIAGPLIHAPVSRVSLVWFSDSERATATAISSIASHFGLGVAFVLGPYIVATDIDNMRTFIFITTFLACLPLPFVIIYFPDRPKSFPSAAAAEQEKDVQVKHQSYIGQFFSLWKVPSFLSLSVAGGMQAGLYYAWSTTIPTNLVELPFSQTEAGWLTSATRFAGIFGGLLAGRMADVHRFRKNLKSLILIFLFCSIVPLMVFTLALPSPAFDDSVFPMTYSLIVASVSIAGFFLGAVTPLVYEIAAELTYPINEGTSAGFLTLFNNAMLLVVLSILSAIDPQQVNTIMTVTMGIAFVIVALFVREDYRRNEAGEVNIDRREGVKAVIQYYQHMQDGDADDAASTYGDNDELGDEDERKSTASVNALDDPQSPRSPSAESPADTPYGQRSVESNGSAFGNSLDSQHSHSQSADSLNDNALDWMEQALNEQYAAQSVARSQPKRDNRR